MNGGRNMVHKNEDEAELHEKLLEAEKKVKK